MFKLSLATVALLATAVSAHNHGPSAEYICGKLNNLPENPGKSQKIQMQSFYAMRSFWEPPLLGLEPDLQLDNVRVDKCDPVVYLNLDSWHVPAQVMTAFVKGTSICYFNDFMAASTLTVLGKDLSISKLMGDSYEMLELTCVEKWGLPPYALDFVLTLQQELAYALGAMAKPLYDMLRDIMESFMYSDDEWKYRDHLGIYRNKIIVK